MKIIFANNCDKIKKCVFNQIIARSEEMSFDLKFPRKEIQEAVKNQLRESH